MRRKRLCILCIGMLLLLACSDAVNSRKSAATTEEEHLLQEPLRAAPVLIRRLRDAVQLSDSVLIVDGENSYFLLPLNSPWVVDCGLFGIRAIFGNSLGADETTRNDVTVILSHASVEKMDCRKLIMVVGKELKAIVAGN